MRQVRVHLAAITIGVAMLLKKIPKVTKRRLYFRTPKWMMFFLRHFYDVRMNMHGERYVPREKRKRG
jgi:hypothetical protein